MSGLAARVAANLRSHFIRSETAPFGAIDPTDARTRWSQQRPFDQLRRPFEELRFPLTEAITGADYWQARCELAEADADRLYAFTNPARTNISPAVVEWVRQQHVDAVHYRTAARDRLVPQ